MAIKNKRLKAYINSNTTSIIRSRANDCKVTALNFNPDENTFEANVNGSSGIPYVVKFSGLTTNPITSSCTCPFDHGPVCKHEVAVAQEAEAYFVEKVIDSIEESIDLPVKLPTKQEKKYSASKPYIIPINTIYEEDIDEVIRRHASATLYREYEYYSENRIHINKQDTNCIHLIAEDGYWSDERKDVMLKKNEEQLSILCSCRVSNQRLCKHQARSLDYISKNLPSFFYSEKRINETKEQLLQQYGFSLKEPTYKEYFDFDYEEGQLTTIPKKAGLLRLSKFKDFQSFNESFLTNQSVTENQLPFISKKKKREKEKGLGIVFSFVSVHESDEGIIIYPIKGNINKEKTDIVNKIEIIDADVFLKDKDLYTAKQASVIEKVLLISADYSDQVKKDYDREKIILKYLKELLPLLDESIFLYKTTDRHYYNEKLYRRDLDEIELKKENPRLFFKVNEEAHFYVLKAYSEINNKTRQLPKNKSLANLFFFYRDKAYYLYRSIYDVKAFIYFDVEPELRINKTDFDAYYAEFIKPLSEQFEVIITHKKSKIKKIAPDQFKKQVYLSEYDELVVFKPVIEYNNKHVNALSNSYIEEHEGETIYKIKRDKEFETTFLETIKKLHPNFEYQDETIFYLDKEEFIENAWFLNAFENLKENEIEVFGFDKLSKMKYNMHKPSINVQTNSGIDWFDLEIEIKFGDQVVSLKDVRKSIVKKSNYVQLKDGTLGILPEEWINKYSHAFRAGEVKKDGITISKYQLSVIDSLYDTLDTNSEMATNHLKIKSRLNTFNEIDQVAKPRGLKATLRGYQKEGLNWLNFLDEYNFGGCLADDMGLGKTLQIITFLKHLKNTKKPKNATLIVLPTSLIFNWQEEVKKFSPSLKFIVHTGSEREKTIENFSTVDIVFTTYGIVMRDIDILKEYIFNYIILDESQAIKNPNSQRFKSVRLLRASNKLVLTGTPIENNTFDLYAQMTFVNPGLLGNMANFKNEYATPIDKNKDPEVANDLRKLIKRTS